jgi:hypothetical protein
MPPRSFGRYVHTATVFARAEEGSFIMSSSSTVKAEHTGWAGWILFAAMMMLMIGIFNALSGLAAIVENELFITGQDGALVVDMTTWGWVHLVLGAAVAAVGAFLMREAPWARYAAIGLLMVNIMTQMLALPAYPVWALVVITIDVLALWALVVHGRASLGDVR